MTNLIKKKERNDGFAESNASPPCVGHAFMNAKPDPYESFESCNDCGDSLNLGQRILNSKRVQGSKLCGPCHQKELKAWKNGEFVAHDGKEYEGKQPRRTESERRERKRERRKAKSNRKWHPTGPRRQEKAGNGGRGKATRTFHNGKS